VFPASRSRTERHSAALYAKPASIADLKLTRAQIEEGALAGKGIELFWADPIDAFFAQIQGSARLRLEDGSVHKLEYVAKTDHPYTSVGRVLIDRGIISKEEMSMQAIRVWMSANPEAAIELRRENKPFVFFAASPAVGDEQGHGAQGFNLVPRRSIAVDNKLHPYGTLMFISADLPIDSAEPTTKFRHLMVAMDTGSAIVGPARADIYWGVGDAAAEVAGRFKHRGTFVMLVPR
jgi:membrane-bound lytic murein transglycosylase A